MEYKLWYEDIQVSESILKARQFNLPYLVYIYDEDDETSIKLNQSLETPQVVEMLKEKYLGIKVNSNTQTYLQFEQLVPIPKKPILYVFYDGSLVTRMEKFPSRIESLTEKLLETFATIKQNKNKNKNNKGDQSKDKVDKSSSSSIQQAKLGMKQKISELNRRKEEKRVQEEKTQQLERREQTKQLLEAKKLLEDQQLEKLRLEKVKEKKEAIQAKRQVQLLIQQDKQERKKSSLATSSSSSTSTLPLPSTSTSGSKKLFFNETKLSIRLPNNSTIQNTFPSQTTSLTDVKQFLMEKEASLCSEPFDLYLVYPKYKFEVNEEVKSLAELNLGTSNSLIVKLIRTSTQAYTYNDGSILGQMHSLLSGVYSTSTSLFTSLVNSLPLHPQPTTTTSATTPTTPVTQPTTSSSSHRSTNLRTLNTLSTSSGNPKDTTEDKEITYNGNSTNQQ